MSALVFLGVAVLVSLVGIAHHVRLRARAADRRSSRASTPSEREMQALVARRTTDRSAARAATTRRR